jgi:hypothetical protein
MGGNWHALGETGLDVPAEVINRVEYTTWFEDFIYPPGNDVSDVATAENIVVTQISGGGSASIIAHENGVMQLDCPAANDGPIVQWDTAATDVLNVPIPLNAVAGTNANTEINFGARIRVLDVSASSLFVGLAEEHHRQRYWLIPKPTLPEPMLDSG